MIKEKRLDDIYTLDMKIFGNDFIGKYDLNKDFYIPYIDILCKTDIEWKALITKMINELINRRKDEKN